MPVKRVDPSEAAELIAQGWTFVDVRSVPEFEAGHPTGAYNCPLLHKGPAGMAPNPEFKAVALRVFAREQKLVIGCRSGQRSLRAAELLLGEGFEHVVDMRGGFAGERHPDGSVACEGWHSRGLPVSGAPEPGRSWDDLKRG